MQKFNIGDRVTPNWKGEPYLTGTIIGIHQLTPWTVYRVVWDQDSVYAENNTLFAETNLKLLKEEKKVNTITCKPIPNVLEISGGNFTHVVVAKETNKIVAAFIHREDAIHFIDYGYCDDGYIIREVV